MTIICDVYEPDKIKNACDKVESISVDYLIEGSNGKFVVERKTWMDLIGSTRDGRLWDQIKRIKLMESQGYKPLLLVEGYKYMLFKKKIVHITEAQLQGILLGVAKMGVPILYAENQELTIMLLKHMDMDTGKAGEWVRPTIPKTGRNDKEEAEDVLAAIDGIGRKTAQKLLKEYRTLKNLFESETIDIGSIIGIREAKHIEEVLNREYS